MARAPYFPGVCSVNESKCDTRQDSPRLTEGIPNNQGNDYKGAQGYREPSLKSKLLSLIFSALVSGNVDASQACFVNIASPEVLQIANGYDKYRLHEDAQFLIDSGAARHCCFEKARFKNLRYGTFGCVKVADGRLVPIVACGDVGEWTRGARVIERSLNS